MSIDSGPKCHISLAICFILLRIEVVEFCEHANLAENISFFIFLAVAFTTKNINVNGPEWSTSSTAEFLLLLFEIVNRIYNYFFVGKFHINLNSNHVQTHTHIFTKRRIQTNSALIMYPTGNENQRNLNRIIWRNKKWKWDKREIE